METKQRELPFNINRFDPLSDVPTSAAIELGVIFAFELGRNFESLYTSDSFWKDSNSVQDRMDDIRQDLDRITEILKRKMDNEKPINRF